jgi:4-hydroxy-tetrahydrodipicolinate reductase
LRESTGSVVEEALVLGLVGAGRTGSVVADVARENGIAIAWTARARDGGLDALEDDTLCRARVVIEFSVPEAAERTLERCLGLNLPVVSGTTGWEQRRSAWIERYRQHNGALVYADNFSIGVHAFLRAAEEAARVLGELPEYDAYVQELHHKRKADAPSGTARALANRVLPHLSGKSQFTVVGAGSGRIPAESLSVAITRAGSIPGTHTLGFDGPYDALTVTHQARSNRGFAAGALLAARWIVGRIGVWSAGEMFDLIANQRRDR